MDAQWMLKPTKERSRTIQIPTNQYKTSYLPHTNLQYKFTIFSDICKKIAQFVAYVKNLLYLCTRNECEGTHWPSLYSMAMPI
jgi:hypothetical protein